jgi:hypothetical protein
MANGNGGTPRIPGFSLIGGISLSNTAILAGGIALAAWIWFMNAQSRKIAMVDPEQEAIDTVEGDVYSYAANSDQARGNSDRVRAAVERGRSVFRAALDAFRKKHQDLIKARRDGTITSAQYVAQLKLARIEYQKAIRQRWKEIHDALGISTRNPHVARVQPTQA